MLRIFDDLYMVEMPLIDNPLKCTNCYILKGQERNLIIDLGFDHIACRHALDEAMAELCITMENTDFFITHLHVDHSGLCAYVKRDENTIYASFETARRVNLMVSGNDYVDVMSDFAGVPDADRLKSGDHVAARYQPKEHVDFHVLKGGDTLTVGQRTLTAVPLAGHAPGEMGLFDQKEGLFFCGDNILFKITPNIACWDFETDYLGEYFKNLEMVKSMGIKRLFTAHRTPPLDIAARCDELREHHEARLREVYSILQESGGEMTAYSVASFMVWSIKGGFSDFGRMQKWFACSEAMAHLEHLCRTGRAKKQEGRLLHYRLV